VAIQGYNHVTTLWLPYLSAESTTDYRIGRESYFETFFDLSAEGTTDNLS